MREVQLQALAPAQRRGERSRPIPPVAMFLGLGALYWYLGAPLWVQVLNGLVWAWAEYGARRLAGERRMAPLVDGEGLERLRWELTRRERALEVSWPWDFAPRMAAHGLVLFVFGLRSSSWGAMAFIGLLTWLIVWMERKRDRLELRMEFAALDRWEKDTSRLI